MGLVLKAQPAVKMSHFSDFYLSFWCSSRLWERLDVFAVGFSGGSPQLIFIII